MSDPKPLKPSSQIASFNNMSGWPLPHADGVRKVVDALHDRLAALEQENEKLWNTIMPGYKSPKEPSPAKSCPHDNGKYWELRADIGDGPFVEREWKSLEPKCPWCKPDAVRECQHAFKVPVQKNQQGRAFCIRCSSWELVPWSDKPQPAVVKECEHRFVYKSFLGSVGDAKCEKCGLIEPKKEKGEKRLAEKLMEIRDKISKDPEVYIEPDRYKFDPKRIEKTAFNLMAKFAVEEVEREFNEWANDMNTGGEGFIKRLKRRLL